MAGASAGAGCAAAKGMPSRGRPSSCRVHIARVCFGQVLRQLRGDLPCGPGEVPAVHEVLVDAHVDQYVTRALQGVHGGGHCPACEAEVGCQLAHSRLTQLYGGDFLEEDAYEPWTAGCREHARNSACEASRALARLAARRSDDESVCRHLRRVVERDPHDEEAWLSHIATLVRMRRHGEARRAYATYTRRINKLGVVPAPFDRSQPPPSG